MALKDRIRAAVARKPSTAASPSTSPSGSPTSSGYSSPATLSPTPSTVLLPALLPSATASSTSSKSLKLSKTSSSTSSRFSLSRYRSNSKARDQHIKYAPKNYKYAPADPARIAVIEAWEWEFGGKARGSVCSGVSPCASPRNSLDA